MPSDVVKIRVKSGSSEAEVEADLSHIREAIELIPEVVKQLPDHRPTVVCENSQFVPPRNGGDLPAVILEKNDSLSEIVAKFLTPIGGGNEGSSQTSETPSSRTGSTTLSS